jgi:hypothetical protein
VNMRNVAARRINMETIEEAGLQEIW